MPPIEHKIINGVLHWRHTRPKNQKWIPYSAKELTQMLTKQEQKNEH